MRALSRFPDKSESASSALIRLQDLLRNCTDKNLAAFTPEHLAATHRVPIKSCEYELIVARQRRGL